MSRNRRAPATLAAAAVDAAVTALEAAGVEATATDTGITAFLDGKALTIAVEPVAYCTGERARELARRRSRGGRPVRMVVADRMTADAKAILSDAGWSWLDRRGRLRLRAPGVHVDVEVPASVSGGDSSSVLNPIAGRSGFSVAYWLCDHPGEALSPTKSSPALDLAPSTISTTVRRLIEAGLVDDDGTGIFPELFWELASVWLVERTWLLVAPEPPHRTTDPEAPSWRRSGTAAAAAYGAPVVTSERGPLELYVPGPVDVSIAVRRYGPAPPGTGAAALAVAPVAAAVAGADDAPVLDGWQLAPRLTVALDLAQDRSRGREILDQWETPNGVWR